jgi:TolA-binding protein
MATTKRAFGVFQDGESIRIACLALDKNVVNIERLYRDSLTITGAPPASSGFSAYNYDSGGENDGYGASSSSMGSELEFEEIDSVHDEFSGTTGLDNLTHIINEVSMTQGPIALNLEVSNVRYRKLQLSHKLPKKKILNEIKKEFALAGTASYLTTTYLPCGADEVVGIAHEGSMDLLEKLVTVNETVFHHALRVERIQPNEIALINGVRFNYEIAETDFIAIFYIGVDFSRITLMNGRDYYMDLPIINEGFASENIINTIYSRYLLEKAQYHIPQLTRIFLAGSGIDQNALEMLVEKDPDVKVEILLPLHLTDNPDFVGDYTERDLTEFIIPIMLAAASLFPKNPAFLHPDFLPKELKQKNLSIGLTGIVLLACTLTTGLVGMQMIFKQRAENQQIKQDIQAVRMKIDENRSKIEMINGLKAQITDIENNMARVKSLIGDKNQWHYVMEMISESFGSGRMTWSTNLVKEAKGFRLKGTTVNRKQIVEFSQLFPNGKIDKINEKMVVGRQVWDFEIVFGMPDAIETKRRDFEVNGIPLPTFEELAAEDQAQEEQADASATPDAPATPAPASPAKAAPASATKTTTTGTTVSAPQHSGPAPANATLYNDALDAYRRNRLDEAITKFQQYANENHDSYQVNATYFVGECYYQEGNFTEAMAYFERVIGKGKAKMPEALLLSGKIAYNLGNYEKARDYWTRLVDDYPDSEYTPMARNKLARMDK